MTPDGTCLDENHRVFDLFHKHQPFQFVADLLLDDDDLNTDCRPVSNALLMVV
jgi:hypothetical protein